MKNVLLTFSLVAALAAVSAPGSVSVGSVSQDAETRLVTIAYSLGGSEEAIVTASVVHDSQSHEIGDKTVGEINARVAPGSHTFTWQPVGSLANADFAAGDLELKLKAWSLSTPPDFMAVSLSGPSFVRYYASADVIPGGIQDSRYFSDMLLMRKIPAKNVRYRMGAVSTEDGFSSADPTTTYVTLDKDFYLGVYECTQRQWQRMTGSEPPTSKFMSPTAYAGKAHDAAHRLDWERHPMVGGTWNSITAALSAFATVSGLAFALPSEAEWEFACRAGCGSELYTGKAHNNDNCREVAVIHVTMSAYYGAGGILGNYADPMPCGLLVPNAWNLYDMLGNVREFCADEVTGQKVLRGGDCAWSRYTCRAGARELANASDGDTYRSGFRFYLPIQ